MRKLLLFVCIFQMTYVLAQNYEFVNEKTLEKMPNNFIYNYNYIGGIKDSTPIFKGEKFKYSTIVYNKEQLLNSLRDSTVLRKIIYIPNNISIDLSGEKNIQIPENTIVYSDRGMNGSYGGKIFTTTSGTMPLFNVGNNVRISGLRIEGSDKNIYHDNIIYEGKDAINQNRYKDPVSDGFHVRGSNFVIENCELYGWTYSAVHLMKNSTSNVVRYNYFHHNRRYGLGYGIVVNGGEVKIYGNSFNYNRHDIAGTGIIGSGYEVFYNIFLSNTYSDSIDMHGGFDRKDNTDIGGSYMYVYNNYFERIQGKRKAALLRGVPLKKSFFKNNYVRVFGENLPTKFIDKDQFQQINDYGNLELSNNIIIPVNKSVKK